MGKNYWNVTCIIFSSSSIKKTHQGLKAAETWEIMHIDHDKTKFDNIYQQGLCATMHMVLYEMCVFIAIDTSYPSKYEY